MEEMLALVRPFVRPGTALGADTPLLSSGLVSSLDFAGVILAVEKRFRVAIDIQDVGADNFDTPAQMLAYVQRLCHP